MAFVPYSPVAPIILAISPPGSSRDQPGQDLSRTPLQDVRRPPAERRGVQVDLDDRDAPVEGGVGERGRGLDEARGPDDEHQVAGVDGSEGAADQGGRQGFPEPDDVGPQQAAAGAARRKGAGPGLAVFPEFPAGEAAGPPEAAVDFEQVAGSREGMEAVDVLGDQGQSGTARLEGGERRVAGVGARLRDESPAPVVPFPDEAGIAFEGLRRGEVLRPEVPPEAPRPPEGGDPGFGGAARAGEG